METLDIDTLLERNKIKEQIHNFLDNYDENSKSGIYLYGESSIGKTHFIKNLLKEKYSILYLDSLDLRNKNKIEIFKNNNMAKNTIMNSFSKKNKQIVIVLDDIETMNTGDKGGINSLSVLIKKKKNKNNNNDRLINPIICINNYFSDKKINDLRKNLINIEIKKPSTHQISNICKKLFDDINSVDMSNLVDNIDGNLNRVNLHLKSYSIFGYYIPLLSYNKNNTFYKAAEIALTENMTIQNYTSIIKETDKTSISLLFHENIIDIFKITDNKLYLEILDNFCYGDYIDRQIFQHQLWEFNDISFLIKLIFNNNILLKKKNTKDKVKLENIRFTKVLTKYSSEYSNKNFINYLCQKFNIDKKDVYLLFNIIKDTNTSEQIIKYFSNYELKPLEIKRFYKFLDMELS
jgi:hypothetical protein